MSRLEQIFFLSFPVRVTSSDNINSGADGGMSLALRVNFLDLLENVSKDLDVQMISHQDQQEPVSEADHIPENCLGLVRNDGRIVGDEEHSDTGAEHGDDPEDEMNARDGEKHEEPEPKKDVDLVIDHVDGKDAETIKPGGKLNVKCLYD